MNLYDMTGRNCGNFSDGVAPDGYWLRSDDAPEQMAALDFLDKIGAVRFAGVWQASFSNPAMAFTMARGLAAQSIRIEESFPILLQLEQAGVLPTGTAIEVWS